MGERLGTSDSEFDHRAVSAPSVALSSAHTSPRLGSASHSRRPRASAGLASHLMVPLLGAWWSLDTMGALGPRGLWGYIVLLAEHQVNSWHSEVGSDPAGPRMADVPALCDLAGCFIRRWVWRLLVTDTGAAWQSAAKLQSAAAPPPDVEHNALAWARKQRAGSNAGTETDSGSRASSGCARELALVPFDLHAWLPELDGPLSVLREQLRPLLVSACNESGHAAACHRRELALILPLEAQARLASLLWRDVRQQLLATEPQLREGEAEPTALGEAGRTLLAVAALSLGTAPADAHAALRALLRLCSGQAAALRAGLRGALPVLLWLADATGATGWSNRSTDAADPSSLGAAAELVAALLPKLAGGSANPVEDTVLAVTALLRVPAASGASGVEPLACVLEKAAAATAVCPRDAAENQSKLGSRAAVLRTLVPRLRQWLECHRRSLAAVHGPESTTTSDDAAADLAAVTRMETALGVLRF